MRGRWTALRRWRDANPVLSLLALAAATRVLVVAANTLGGLLLAQYPWPLAWTADAPVWLRHLARWDSEFYLEIARQGRVLEVRPERWAFSPGYPMAVRAVLALAPPLGELGAAFVVGTAAVALAVVLLYHLTVRWFDRETAWRATALFVMLPGSFYFAAVYADGLFVALLLGMFLALAHRRWLLAGALASLAAVTRPQGLLLPGVILLAALLDRARTGRTSPTALLAVPLAAALPAFDMYLAYAATGDPLFAHHVRSATWPQVTLRNPLVSFLWGLGPLHGALVRGSYVLLLLAGAWALLDARRRRLDAPLEVHAWTFAYGAVCFLYSDPAAMVRFLLPVLAVPWMLGAWARTPRRFVPVAALGLAALLTVAALFGAWYPYY